MNCPTCGAQAAADQKFCRGCGIDLADVRRGATPDVRGAAGRVGEVLGEDPRSTALACGQCGAIGDPEQKFCRSCGAGLPAAVAAAAARRPADDARSESPAGTAAVRPRTVPTGPRHEPSVSMAFAGAAVGSPYDAPGPVESESSTSSTTVGDGGRDSTPSELDEPSTVVVEAPAAAGGTRAMHSSSPCEMCGAPAAGESPLCTECNGSDDAPSEDRTEVLPSIVATRPSDRMARKRPKQEPRKTGASRRRAAVVVATAVALAVVVAAAAAALRPWENASDSRAPRAATAIAAAPSSPSRSAPLPAGSNGATATTTSVAPAPLSPGPTPTRAASTSGSASVDDRVTVIPEEAGDDGTPEPVAEDPSVGSDPVSGDTASVATFRRYLTALAQHDYEATWAYFSSPPGGSSRLDWIAGQQAYDARVASGRLEELSRDGSEARVRVSFYTHDRGDAERGTPAGLCHWFHGTVVMVRRGDQWLYEPTSVGRSKLAKTTLTRADDRCAPLLD